MSRLQSQITRRVITRWKIGTFSGAGCVVAAHRAFEISGAAGVMR